MFCEAFIAEPRKFGAEVFQTLLWVLFLADYSCIGPWIIVMPYLHNLCIYLIWRSSVLDFLCVFSHEKDSIGAVCRGLGLLGCRTGANDGSVGRLRSYVDEDGDAPWNVSLAASSLSNVK